MTTSEWLPPAEWYASLPTVYVAAGGLITDSAGGILLVKPNYRDHWGFPGGIVDFGEPPHEACGRELSEELGVSLPVGSLLLTAWAPPVGERPKPMIYLLYDCGVLPASAEITLQVSELDAYAFLPYAEAFARLDPMVASRLPAAMEARRTGQAAYLVTAPV
jgi:ADP-ribose pyrophosphatase YjhB (NUDIX family)